MLSPVDPLDHELERAPDPACASTSPVRKRNASATPMAETLNPRLDVVFKLLMADPSNRELLLSLLNAVLQPARPIVSADVVNPEIQKDDADDRGLVLDILSVHDDGTRSDVEMQIDNRGATEKRALYHWARVYRDGIGRGDDYSDLHPCRVVFILAFRLLPGSRIHSTFRLQEAHDGTVFSNDLEIHTLELTKVGDAAESDPKEKAAHDWARFLAAETDEERQEVAMQNRDINKANQALGRLSKDPEARALARWREDQLRLYRVELTTAERRGREEGRLAGGAAILQRQLERKFGPLSDQLKDRLAAATEEQLDRWADRILIVDSLEAVFSE
jgi:predicted transposase/invertase (TIGR01784 family)